MHLIHAIVSTLLQPGYQQQVATHCCWGGSNRPRRTPWWQSWSDTVRIRQPFRWANWGALVLFSRRASSRHKKQTNTHKAKLAAVRNKIYLHSSSVCTLNPMNSCHLWISISDGQQSPIELSLLYMFVLLHVLTRCSKQIYIPATYFTPTRQISSRKRHTCLHVTSRSPRAEWDSSDTTRSAPCMTAMSLKLKNQHK